MIVIGLLRFLGLVNAAVWFGASFFFIFIGEPASSSGSMQALLGPKSFPYFSAAISQLLGTRFFGLFLVCAVVAMLHVGAEWLYFGKYPRRVWLLLIFGLFLGGLIQSYGLQPKLQDRLAVQFSSNNRPEQRESARHSFRLWHAMSTCLDVVLLSGIGIYLWRVANPPDEMRFVGASNLKGNFRG